MKRLIPCIVLLAATAALRADASSAVASPVRSLDDLSQYVHRSWRRLDGLPQESVGAIAQTRDGYLWLGTQEGLVRFDGITFRLFNKANTPAFTHNEVSALVEGPDGSLWIGTFGGLLQYSAGRFVAHPTGLGREREAITSVAVASDGSVWVGTQSGGVNYFQAGRYHFVGLESGLPSLSIEDLVIDGGGHVWVATLEGVARQDAAGWRRFTDRDGLPSARTMDLLPAAGGGVWVGTDRGVGRVVADGVQPGPALAATAGAVTALFEERDGTLWAGTENGEAWRWAAGSSSSRVLSAGLSNNRVDAMVGDREGNVWVGTYMSGLHRLWRGRFGSLTPYHGLPGPSLRSILQTRTGDMWLSSDGDGLARFDGHHVTRYGLAEGLPHLVSRALLEDASGTVWAGTRGGLARFDGTRFRTIDSTRGMIIRALAEDASGDLWVGARDQVYRLVGGRLETRTRDGHTELPRGTIRTLFRDRDGAMWVGTNSSLTRLAGASIRVFTSQDGLPADAVYCVHQDAAGTLWFGSYGGGIVRLKDGRFTRFRQADGLFDDVAYQILEDELGYLWVSCNNGVYRVRRADLDAFASGAISRIPSVAFDASDGMPSGECNGNAQPAGWRDRDGRLWFPTTAGAVIIDPDRVDKNDMPPLVAIESVTAGRREFQASKRAVLAPGTGQVSFTYTGLSFVAPRKVRFKYRLEGLEADWVDAGDRRQTGYSNLTPGRYVFRVAASNNDGVWSEADASFEFVLEPRFHQTIWFRGLVVVLALGVLAGGYRIRVWRHVQRERELTARVDQAVSRIKILSGLIPICASCKNIRDDSGYWNQLEQYLKTHSEAQFSHGICPDCMRKLYPDYVEADGSVVPPAD